METNYPTPVLHFPETFGDNLTPETIEKWAAGRFDEDGDFIVSGVPRSPS
ncbi:MAG: hypothetical protein WCA28_12140 [Bradyrhizobium sp.]